MGINLIARKNGVSACLGRSYHYKVDGVLPDNEHDIWDEIIRITNDTKLKLSSFASYSPNNLKDLEEIFDEVNEEIDEVNEEIEYLKNELINYGKAIVITELKENGFEITEE